MARNIFAVSTGAGWFVAATWLILGRDVDTFPGYLVGFGWIFPLLCATVITTWQMRSIRRTFATEQVGAIGSWVDVFDARTADLWLPNRKSRKNDALREKMRSSPLGFLVQPSREQIRSQARESLLTCLPLLNEEDSDLLSPRQRQVLFQMLSGQDSTLILAILEAAPAIGDMRALPYIETLASGGGLAATEPDICEAAARSLSLLEANLKLRAGSATLLRPSPQPGARPDSLLRASSPRTPDEKESEQLLRPGNE